MELNPAYLSAWAVWGFLFAAIEGAALKNKNPGDTLTEHVRAVFALRDKPKGWQFRRAGWVAFLVWFNVHFW